MKIINIVVLTLTLGLAVIAYWKGGYRNLSAGISEGTQMFLPILPVLLCSFFMAGYLRVLLPEAVVLSWLGTEAGWRGIAVSYLAGTVTFGGPFVSFPIAATFFQVGASAQIVTVYITSWALWGGGIAFYELAILGPKFFAARLAVNFLFPLLAGAVVGILMKSG